MDFFFKKTKIWLITIDLWPRSMKHRAMEFMDEPTHGDIEFREKTQITIRAMANCCWHYCTSRLDMCRREFVSDDCNRGTAGELGLGTELEKRKNEWNRRHLPADLQRNCSTLGQRKKRKSLWIYLLFKNGKKQMNQIVERKWTISLQRPAAVELCCWPTSSCHYPLVTYYSSSVYSFKLSTVKHTTHDKCAIWLDSDSDCTTSLITNTRIHRTVWCWFICHQMFPSTTVASMAVILRLSVICFRWFEWIGQAGGHIRRGVTHRQLVGSWMYTGTEVRW